MALYLLFGAIYLLLARRCRRTGAKSFALLNITFLAVIIYYVYHALLKRHAFLNISVALAMAALYAAAILLQYRAMGKGQWQLAFWSPLAALIGMKLVGFAALAGVSAAVFLKEDLLLIGLSYLAFKLSYAVMEVKTGRTPLPGKWEYLGYALYAPALFVGPINPLATQSARRKLPVTLDEIKPHLMRIMVGLLKMTFLAELVNRLGYEALITQAAAPSAVDYFIAVPANLIFLYLNFAGMCDIVIAGSGLLGIPVKENFNYPFLARSVQDFWSRWHMTLSQYFKDIVFTPLTLWLTSLLGARHVNHAIALGILAVFLLIGLWHGAGLNFLLLGLFYGLAVVGNHYYTLLMKAWLGKHYARYYRNPVIRAAAIAVTFAFVSTVALLLNHDAATFFAAVAKMWSILT